jgi:hypothetical protein
VSTPQYWKRVFLPNRPISVGTNGVTKICTPVLTRVICRVRPGSPRTYCA